MDALTFFEWTAILGPLIALGGHGSLAVLAIRKAHREAKDDYTAKIDESRAQVTADLKKMLVGTEEEPGEMRKVIDAKFRVLDERTDLSALKAKLDQLEKQLDEARARTVREIKDSVEIPHVPSPEEIAAAFPEIPSVAAGLEEFLRSSAGVAWAGELASVVGTEIQQQAAKKLEGVVGGMLRTDEKRLAEVLRNVRFGNPMLDGVWGIAMGQPDLVHLVAGRLAKAFHAAGGLTNVLGNEHEAGDTPQLTGNEGYV